MLERITRSITGYFYDKHKDSNVYCLPTDAPKDGENTIYCIPTGIFYRKYDLLIVDNLSTDQDDNIEDRYEKDKEEWKRFFDVWKPDQFIGNTKIIILYSGSINLDGTLEGIGIISDSDLKLVPIKLQLLLGCKNVFHKISDI